MFCYNRETRKDHAGKAVSITTSSACHSSSMAVFANVCKLAHRVLESPKQAKHCPSIISLTR
jgi:hypothetical protein